MHNATHEKNGRNVLNMNPPQYSASHYLIAPRATPTKKISVRSELSDQWRKLNENGVVTILCVAKDDCAIAVQRVINFN